MLRLLQTIIQPPLFHQLRMIAFLNDMPLVNDENPIRPLDGREAVRALAVALL
jgi:hypothetical protein